MRKFIPIFTILLLTFSAVGISAQTNIKLKPNKKFVIKAVFAPKSDEDAIIYRFKARKDQTINIKVRSNEIDLGGEYPCSVGFWLYDDADEMIFDGDYPAAPDDYIGEMPKNGFYKLKIVADSPEGCSDEQIKEKKPRFDYKLEILLK